MSRERTSRRGRSRTKGQRCDGEKKGSAVKSGSVKGRHIVSETSRSPIQGKNESRTTIQGKNGSRGPIQGKNGVSTIPDVATKVGNKVILPRPNAIIMKMFGVVASYKFERQMIEYGSKNLQGYLRRRWNQEKIIPHLVARLRKDARLDWDAGETSTPQIPEKGSEERIQEAVCKYVSFKLSQGALHTNSPIYLLNGWVVNEGYIAGTFHTHVFKDAAKCVHDWRYGENYIKNYTLASAEREGQRNYIQSTCEGDLTSCFNNYIPLVTERRGIELRTYQVIQTMIRDESKNLLFISDNPLEIKAAHEAKFVVVLIQRPGEPKADPKDMVGLGHVPIIHSFHQLVFVDDPDRPPPCC